MPIIIYKISYLITFCGAIIMGLFVFSTKRGLMNILWGILHVGVVFWSIGRFQLLSVDSIEQANFWLYITFLGSIIIYPFVFHFILEFLEISKKKKTVIILCYFFAFLSLIGLLADFLFKEFVFFGSLQILDDSKIKYVENFNWASLPHQFNQIFVPVYGLYELFKELKVATRIKRNQIFYVICGLVLGIIGGNTVLFLSYGIQIEPYGVPLIPLYLFIISYAIYKNRLMNINYFASKTISYLFLTLLFIAPCLIVIYFSAKFYVDRNNFIFLIILFLLFAISIYLIPKLRQWSETTITSVLFKRKLAYDQTISQLSKFIVSNIKLEKIVNKFIESTKNALKVDFVSIFILKEGQYCNVVNESNIDIDEKHDLIKYFYKTSELILKEEVLRTKEFSEKQGIVKLLDDLSVEVGIPLNVDNKILALMFFGTQQHGEFYSIEDIEFINNITNLAAAAFKNSLSYKRIEDLSKNLEKKVEERTKKLRETQGQLVQAEKMASLGRLASGMAHEIMNPVNFIQNSAEPLQENVKKLAGNPKLSKKQLKELKEDSSQLFGIISEGVDRIVKIVRGITTFTRGVTRDFETYDINKAVESALFISENEHKKIGITTDLRAAKEIKCNKGQINQVVLNILMNAFEAVDKSKGRVEVKSWDEDKEVKLSIKDNGPGIKEQDKLKIFDPFYTTKEEAPGQNVGLGLSICYNIIDVHRGRIDVNSKEGEGAEFVVGLPVK